MAKHRDGEYSPFGVNVQKHMEWAREDNLAAAGSQRKDKVRMLPLFSLMTFQDHPFKVRDDTDMDELVADIRTNGLIEPIIVREKDDEEYEILAGHRRKRAYEILDAEYPDEDWGMIPARIVRKTDEEATLIMVNTNLMQRSSILPSEKAWAYRMRLEAMKRQGERVDITSPPLVEKLSGKDALSATQLGKEVGESREQIRRYIRLTHLIPDLLELVDTGRIKFRPSVELSYLAEASQQLLLDYISRHSDVKVSEKQARDLKKADSEEPLTYEQIDDVLFRVKAEQVPVIAFAVGNPYDYIPDGCLDAGAYVIEALKFYIQNKK